MENKGINHSPEGIITPNIEYIITKHAVDNNPSEVAGIIGTSQLDVEIIQQRVGNTEGVDLYSLDDLIAIHLSKKTDFFIYHSHPPCPGQDAASATDTKNFARIEKVLSLLAHYSTIKKDLLKYKYLKEVFEKVRSHPQLSRIIALPERRKKVNHVIAYQNPGVNLLVFSRSPLEIGDIMYDDNRLNRLLLKAGKLKVYEDRPEYDHIVY